MRRPLEHYFKTVQDVEEALDRRLVLGQAQGILMERLNLTPEQAFAFMSRASQNTNTSVHEVAAELVRTRLVPSTIPAAGEVLRPRGGSGSPS